MEQRPASVEGGLVALLQYCTVLQPESLIRWGWARGHGSHLLEMAQGHATQLMVLRLDILFCSG